MKLTQEALDYMLLFERKTGALVKDCIVGDDAITFIIKKGYIGSAIGKKGVIVKKIKEAIGKEIHVYEHSDDPKEFIKNLLYPVKVTEVKQEGDILRVYITKQDKRRAIGKGGKKINAAKELLKRHSNISKIEVL